MCKGCEHEHNTFSIEDGILTIHKAYRDSKPLRFEVAKTKPRNKYIYEVGERVVNDKLDVTILAQVYGKPYGSKDCNKKHFIIGCNKCSGITYKSESNISMSGCGICGKNSYVVYIGVNDLTTTDFEVAQQWHPTKNGDLLPTMFSHGSRLKVWWQCEKGHEWDAVIGSRTINGNGCEECYKENASEICRKAQTNENNLLANKRPDLIQYLLNPQDAYKYSWCSDQLVWTICPICETLKKEQNMVKNLTRYGFSCDNPKCVNSFHYRMSGENNPRYNPNLTDKERKANESRNSDGEWRKCSERVKKRDNNTCQCCGHQQEKGMIAHHKNGWDNFKEQRYDDDNVVTLCPSCHDLFHGEYGYGNNTKEQYTQFKTRYLSGEFNN